MAIKDLVPQLLQAQQEQDALQARIRELEAALVVGEHELEQKSLALEEAVADAGEFRESNRVLRKLHRRQSEENRQGQERFRQAEAELQRETQLRQRAEAEKLRQAEDADALIEEVEADCRCRVEESERRAEEERKAREAAEEETLQAVRMMRKLRARERRLKEQLNLTNGELQAEKYANEALQNRLDEAKNGR